MQIDFLGQCGSESLGPVPYSGTGGQSDFVRAANRSKGGKAFIVLPSTAKDDTISRIVPTLSPGTHVSTSKNDINYVVTEYGVAQLRGKTAKQRTEALIGIAHPISAVNCVRRRGSSSCFKRRLQTVAILLARTGHLFAIFKASQWPVRVSP
jgi:hypothetical protein